MNGQHQHGIDRNIMTIQRSSRYMCSVSQLLILSVLTVRTTTLEGRPVEATTCTAVDHRWATDIIHRQTAVFASWQSQACLQISAASHLLGNSFNCDLMPNDVTWPITWLECYCYVQKRNNPGTVITSWAATCGSLSKNTWIWNA